MDSQTDRGKGGARERQRRRKERKEMVQLRGSRTKQTRPSDAFTLPQVRLPDNRLWYLIPAGAILIVVVIFMLGQVKNEEPQVLSNAIWLDTSWTYGNPTESEINDLANRLKDHGIGTVYAFVSSLNVDNTWSGGPNGGRQFNPSSKPLTQFIEQLRQSYPEVQLLGWIEIWGNLDADGYRLDDLDLQQNVANFSQQTIQDIGFDGVLLDVKPLSNDNSDYLSLLRVTRSRIGRDGILAIAVPPDLTPTNTDLVLPDQIAPDTILDAQFKQRLSLQADQVVITAYQSYRDDPAEYIKWVSYQVMVYTDTIAALNTDVTQIDTQIIISIPAYAATGGHDPNIETIPAALDGVTLGLAAIDIETAPYLAGVAIYADHNLSDNEWQIFREKWVN